MAQNHELALNDYILGMKLVDIAQKYNVSINTVKSWRKRHNWSRDKPVKKSAPIAPQNRKGCTPPKKVQAITEELTEQEQLFCYHYVRTWNAMQAAILSGYSQNKASARVQGCRLMQRPRIKQEVDRLAELFRQDIHLDIRDFLQFCMKVVGADIGDYIRFGMIERTVFGENGPMIDENGEVIKEPVNTVVLGESEKLDTSILQEVKQGKDGIAIKIADKKWAWEQLIKYFDWLPNKWQKQLDRDKLDLERRKVNVLEKNSGVNEEKADLVQFVDDIGSDDDAED